MTIFTEPTEKLIDHQGKVLRTPIRLIDYSGVNVLKITIPGLTREGYIISCKNAITSILLAALDQKVYNGQIESYSAKSDPEKEIFIVYEDRMYSCVRLVITGPHKDGDRDFFRYCFAHEDIIQQIEEIGSENLITLKDNMVM